MTKRAVLIGIDQYQNFGRLHGCVRDVDLMKQSLSTIFGLADANIWVLKDQEATRQKILDKWEELLTLSTETDVVFIHFSGHGSQKINPTKPSNKSESIVPYDSGRPPRPRQKNCDIFDYEIRSYIQRLTAKTEHVFFNFDCCHSGNVTRSIHDTSRCAEPDLSDEEFDPSPHWNTGTPTDSDTERSISNSGAKLCSIFAACLSHQKALETPHPYLQGNACGAWTHSVFKALNNLTGAGRTTSYGNVRHCQELLCRTLSNAESCVRRKCQQVFSGNERCPRDSKYQNREDRWS